MFAVLVACLLGLSPSLDVVRETCDIIEINRVVDEQGRLSFEQLIFWGWSPAHECFLVIDWRMVRSESMRPAANRVKWWDGQTLREVTAGRQISTVTIGDPELKNREVLAQEQRPKLRKGEK